MYPSLSCKARVVQDKPCTSAAAAKRISAFLEQARPFRTRACFACVAYSVRLAALTWRRARRAQHPEVQTSTPDVAQQLSAVAEALAKAE